MNHWRLVVLGTAALITGNSAWAQAQPPVADNSQDEEVNINIDPSKTQSISGSLTLIRTDDFTADNVFVSELFELESEGFEIVPYLRNIAATEGGAVEPIQYVDPVTGEVRNLLQVVYDEYQTDYVHGLIEMLDGPGILSNEGGVRRHFRIRNRLASDIADILLSSEISLDGSVSFDNTTNTLFVFDSESDGSRAVEVARYYDVPPRMVELEVEIFEVDVEDSAQLGLDWDAWKTALGGFGQVTAANIDGPGADFFRFDALLGLDATVLAEFLNYLVNEGRADVVTKTNLTAINGQVASLSSSRRIPNLRHTSEGPISGSITVTTDTDTGEVAQASTTETALRQRVDVGENSEGIFLAFLPTIGTDTMLAEVEAVVSSLVGQNALDEPLFSVREVSTVLTLEDGESVLLGSFDKSTLVEVEDGIPGLRLIPFLGPYLFQETTEIERESKLVVLVTPRVDTFLEYTDEAIEWGVPVPDPRMVRYHVPAAGNAPTSGLGAL